LQEKIMLNRARISSSYCRTKNIDTGISILEIPF